MHKKVEVVIIGAGSAGLSALRQVKKKTDNYLLVDRTPLGTTCARVGCMPSKAMIIAANEFHRRKVFEGMGIEGGDNLTVNIPALLEHVRKMRDTFTGGMVKVTKELAGDNLIEGKGKILGPDRVRVNDEEIEAQEIIVATGSKPKVSSKWKDFGERLLTSRNIFEQKDLPRRIAVVGLGPIGLELGQALARLGLEVSGFDALDVIGRLTDDEVNAKSLDIFMEEFEVYPGQSIDIEKCKGGLMVRGKEIEKEVDAVLAAIGVEPEIADVGLDNLGLELDKKGVPEFDAGTGQVKDMPIFIAGDANGCRPILHEALDEGFIAGQNSISGKVSCYCRRTPLSVIFSSPQICQVGSSYAQLKESEEDFIIGSASMEEQSRAVLDMRNRGLIHVYIDKVKGKLLGAEMICFDGEHLASQLAMAIGSGLTVFDLLLSPFYHPTVEEGLRSALRNGAGKLDKKLVPSELSLCASHPEWPLC